MIPAAARQSNAFLLLYALAWAGATIAYVPLLTLLLPARVEGLAGSQAIGWLALLTFAGAVAASAGNIAFGWLSDVTGARRPWVIAGLAATVALTLALGRAESFAAVLLCLIAWQLALNAMLGPLSAWAGDCVPDAQKGTLGGLLAFAPAAGSLAGVVATWRYWDDPQTRLAVVAAMVVACVLPLLLFGRPRPVVIVATDRPTGSHRAALRMWFVRLLVQISEAALFAFFFLWLRSLSGGFDDAAAARLIALVWGISGPVALLVGPMADRFGQPILPLRIGAVLAAGGLLVMALAAAPWLAIAGYILFGIASSVFLALHTAQTLRVLPRPGRRGRDLGLFNLTNTTPSLVIPWLTLALVPTYGFAPLFLTLALLTGAAAFLLRAPFAAD